MPSVFNYLQKSRCRLAQFQKCKQKNDWDFFNTRFEYNLISVYAIDISSLNWKTKIDIKSNPLS